MPCIRRRYLRMMTKNKNNEIFTKDWIIIIPNISYMVHTYLFYSLVPILVPLPVLQLCIDVLNSLQVCSLVARYNSCAYSPSY